MSNSVFVLVCRSIVENEFGVEGMQQIAAKRQASSVNGHEDDPNEDDDDPDAKKTIRVKSAMSSRSVLGVEMRKHRKPNRSFSTWHRIKCWFRRVVDALCGSDQSVESKEREMRDRLKASAGEVLVDRLNAGHVVGILSMLTGQKQLVSAVCESRVAAVYFQQKSIFPLLKSRPPPIGLPLRIVTPLEEVVCRMAATLVAEVHLKSFRHLHPSQIRQMLSSATLIRPNPYTPLRIQGKCILLTGCTVRPIGNLPEYLATPQSEFGTIHHSCTANRVEEMAEMVTEEDKTMLHPALNLQLAQQQPSGTDVQRTHSRAQSIQALSEASELDFRFLCENPAELGHCGDISKVHGKAAEGLAQKFKRRVAAVRHRQKLKHFERKLRKTPSSAIQSRLAMRPMTTTSASLHQRQDGEAGSTCTPIQESSRNKSGASEHDGGQRQPPASTGTKPQSQFNFDDGAIKASKRKQRRASLAEQAAALQTVVAEAFNSAMQSTEPGEGPKPMEPAQHTEFNRNYHAQTKGQYAQEARQRAEAEALARAQAVITAQIATSAALEHHRHSKGARVRDETEETESDGAHSVVDSQPGNGSGTESGEGGGGVQPRDVAGVPTPRKGTPPTAIPSHILASHDHSSSTGMSFLSDQAVEAAAAAAVHAVRLFRANPPKPRNSYFETHIRSFAYLEDTPNRTRWFGEGTRLLVISSEFSAMFSQAHNRVMEQLQLHRHLNKVQKPKAGEADGIKRRTSGRVGPAAGDAPVTDIRRGGSTAERTAELRNLGGSMILLPGEKHRLQQELRDADHATTDDARARQASLDGHPTDHPPLHRGHSLGDFEEDREINGTAGLTAASGLGECDQGRLRRVANKERQAALERRAGELQHKAQEEADGAEPYPDTDDEREAEPGYRPIAIKRAGRRRSTEHGSQDQAADGSSSSLTAPDGFVTGGKNKMPAPVAHPTRQDPHPNAARSRLAADSISVARASSGTLRHKPRSASHRLACNDKDQVCVCMHRYFRLPHHLWGLNDS